MSLQKITPSELAGKLQTHIDNKSAVLVYVPAPWLGLNDNGGPCGFVRASETDVLTMMYGSRRTKPLEVDLDESERMLMVTIEQQ